MFLTKFKLFRIFSRSEVFWDILVSGWTHGFFFDSNGANIMSCI
jgi:hypothetical protein